RENIPLLLPTSYPADLRSVSSLCHTLTARAFDVLPLSELVDGAVVCESCMHPTTRATRIASPMKTAVLRSLDILPPFTIRCVNGICGCGVFEGAAISGRSRELDKRVQHFLQAKHVPIICSRTHQGASRMTRSKDRGYRAPGGGGGSPSPPGGGNPMESC